MKRSFRSPAARVHGPHRSNSVPGQPCPHILLFFIRIITMSQRTSHGDSSIIPVVFKLFKYFKGYGAGPHEKPARRAGVSLFRKKMPVRSLTGAGRAHALFVFPDALETCKVKDGLTVPADALGLVCHLDGSADDLVGVCKELPAHLPGHGPGAYVERCPLIIA